MPYTDLLFPASINPEVAGDRPCAAAVEIATRLGAHMTGLVLETRLPIPPMFRVFSQDAIDSVHASEAEFNAKAKAAGENLARMAAAAGIGFELDSRVVHAGCEDDVICAVARLHDLTILECPPGASWEDREIVEAVLFGSGRPVIVLPHALQKPPSFQTIVVGWDDSRAAARAMGDAMPFLAAASTVHIVTVDAASEAVRETGGDIVRHLARRNVNAKYVERAGEGQPVGDVLQAYCKEISAGLLVMGAHGHSRLREFILGGATLDVLNETRLPVFLAV